MVQPKPKTFDQPGAGKQKKKEVQRGTQNELEILALIVVENLNIYNSVMERMRQTKARAGVKPGAQAGNAADSKK